MLLVVVRVWKEMIVFFVFGKVYMVLQFIDVFVCKFYYLCLLIIDVCNFCCIYCLLNGYKFGVVNNNGFFSVDEVCWVMCVFFVLGIEKVCFIGGEFFLCCDFIEIIVVVCENLVICQIVVIINGYCLVCDVECWCDVGLMVINVSVDSFDVCQFYVIIGQDKFYQVMDGIDVVFVVGFDKVKVNIVLMCDVNYYQFDIFFVWI